MNNFACIKPLFRYKHVAYYSVCINDDENTIYDEFVEKHTIENNKKLYHIQKWLQVIGKKYGAQKRFFRNEAKYADTSALPPYNKNRKPNYVEFGKNKANNLRLYCFRANSKVVFLFGGDLKTTEKAQNCPNVKHHFELANALTASIENAFKEKDIEWIEDDSLISWNEDLTIHF